MELAAAVSFIDEGGTDLEKARLRGILSPEAPDPDIVGPFLERQNAIGGFPFRMESGLPSVHFTVQSVASGILAEQGG